MVARPTKWGNPHRWQDCPGDIGSADWAKSAAVEAYVEDLHAGQLLFTRDDVSTHLSGHNLACWCALDAPCHADVLLRLARDPRRPEEARLA